MNETILPWAKTSTVGGGASTLFAVAAESPWWVPVLCGLITMIPTILAFIDRRLAASEARRAKDQQTSDPPRTTPKG